MARQKKKIAPKSFQNKIVDLKNNRTAASEDILKQLALPKETRDPQREKEFKEAINSMKPISLEHQVEAALIRATERCYGEKGGLNTNKDICADVVLMSLGILENFYHYKCPGKIEGKTDLENCHIKFLRKSLYIKKGMKKSYSSYTDIVEKGEKEKVLVRLRSKESSCIKEVAGELYHERETIIAYIAKKKTEAEEKADQKKEAEERDYFVAHIHPSKKTEFELILPKMRRPRLDDSNLPEIDHNVDAPKEDELKEKVLELNEKILERNEKVSELKEKISELEEKDEAIDKLIKYICVLTGVPALLLLILLIPVSSFNLNKNDNLASLEPDKIDWSINKNISTEDASDFNNKIDMDEFNQDNFNDPKEHKGRMTAQSDLGL